MWYISYESGRGCRLSAISYSGEQRIATYHLLLPVDLVTIATTPHDTTADFVLWAFDQLGLVCAQQQGVYHVAVPAEEAEQWGECEAFSFAFDPLLCEAACGDEAVELMTHRSPRFEQLIAALQARGQAVHACPAGDPQSVHQISARLFGAYHIEGGGVHLAGCRLEDRPFLRFTYRRADDGADENEPLDHVWLDGDAAPVSEAQRESLGLETIEPCGPRCPRLPAADLDELLAGGEAAAHAHWLQSESAAAPELLVRTLVWVKYAEGKLRFTIGEATAELPFAGWAAQLEAPPLICPESGAATYKIAATDDGRVCAADAIAVCGESQRRVLRSELHECSETGRPVLAEFGACCPVTGKFLLRPLLATCPQCQQQVSPAALTHDRCAACANLQPVAKDEPRMARLLGEYPGLDRWRKWKLAETETAYLAQASSLLRRLLVVVDKQTLEPLYLAGAHRLLPNWTKLPAALRDEMLR